MTRPRAYDANVDGIARAVLSCPDRRKEAVAALQRDFRGEWVIFATSGVVYARRGEDRLVTRSPVVMRIHLEDRRHADTLGRARGFRE